MEGDEHLLMDTLAHGVLPNNIWQQHSNLSSQTKHWRNWQHKP